MSRPAIDVSLFDIMYSCRAMRRLKPDPVPEEVLLQLVDAALQAPSSSNAQNWRFVIVREPATRARIAAEWRKGWAWYKDTIGTAGLRAGEDPGGRERARRAGDYLVDHLEDLPALIFVGIKRDALVARALASTSTVRAAIRHFGLGGALKLFAAAGRANQTGIGATAYPAVQNLLLAARALGLGAVLTTPQLFTPGAYERILGLPRDVALTAVIPVGYPKGKFGPVSRPPAAQVVSWEHYRA